jgi:hypothetical protein
VGFDSLRSRSKWWHQCERPSTGGRLGTRGSGGVPRRRRNRRWTPWVSADSGEKSPQPGGVLSEGKKGEGQRGLRATYSRGDALIKAGSKGIEEGREGLLLGLDHRRVKRLEIDDDRWVPPVGEEESGGWVPVRGWLEWAAGSFLCWAGRVPRGPI